MKSVILTAVTCCLLFSIASARDRQVLEPNIPVDKDVKTIRLEGDIDVANIRFDTHDGGELVTGKVRYDADRVNVDIDFSKDGDEGELRLYSKCEYKNDIDDNDNNWDLSFSRSFDWDVNLEVGFADSRMDLTGLPINRLALDVGASDFYLTFKDANPNKMKKFSVDAGAGDIEIDGIGYANCDRFSFDGGAGDFVLNFEGHRDGFMDVTVDVGVGEVRLEIPDDIPVRVEADEGWFNSIEIHGIDLDEVDDGVYETEDFEAAEFGLEISLDVGMGQATITRAK